MGSISGESSVDWDSQDYNATEEKIFVSVRLRPLNERELSKNDVSDWECINTTTLIYKNTFQERSMAPAAYTFDRVFGPDTHTKQVYEESAKKIALSVLSGINSSIFAYGQTSSGKTYTMSGILEYAIDDIYDYMDKHSDREFVLKFSAMEIYNEIVRDLLYSESPPLRLLDDPVRGTVVEKLTEVIIRDSNHLKEQLAICEAERKIGDTALNEMSSRSHQILCLTVESEAREYLGAENSSTLTATVNFVDLAGSERTSQTMSAGTRLKEGCHINRSLLTLGTVIRKLSKGRNGHVPYRDSKLTRILQHSLGGNARTAILCTMSPAHSHVEQSRSTLVFASCAKQISTNAQVNVVMSEKALVKQLRREIARLENEVKNLSSHVATCDLTPSVKEKEVIIEKLDKEIKQLTDQRDLAESRLETASRLGISQQSSISSIDLNYEKELWTDHEYTASEASDILTDPLHSDNSSRMSHLSASRIEDQFLENYEDQFLSDNTSPRLYIEKYFGPQSPDPGWFVQVDSTKNCKELDCIEIDFIKRNAVASTSDSSSLKQEENSGPTPCLPEEKISDPCEIVTTIKESPTTKVAHVNDADYQGNFPKIEPHENIEELHRQDSHNSIESNLNNKEEEIIKTSGEHHEIIKQEEPCNEVITPKVLEHLEDENKSKSPKKAENEESCTKVVKQFEDGNKSKDPEKAENEESCVPQIKEVIVPELVKHFDDENNLKNPEKAAEEESYVADFNEVITPKVMKQFEDGNTSKRSLNVQDSSDWPARFERQKKEIIELWDTCNIPLVYRTYFFLLFKGDPSENVYMEVELRRLSFLKKNFEETNGVKDDHSSPEASSVKALNREREMLSRKMFKKLSRKERRALYVKWDIDLKSKRRRLQVCRRLWTNTTNMEHIKESAAVVAKLVGFKEPENAPKEMIGLSFKP